MLNKRYGNDITDVFTALGLCSLLVAGMICTPTSATIEYSYKDNLIKMENANKALIEVLNDIRNRQIQNIPLKSTL